jgi:DNA-binding NarL/FixJ family response regulator
MTGAEPSRIRVVLVDDHRLVLESLRMALEAAGDLAVVGVATTAAEAEATVAATEPDVVVVDYDLGEQGGTAAGGGQADGLEVVASIVGHSDARCVMVTGFPGPGLVRRALQAGCVGFVVKGHPLDELVAAVRAAAGHHSFLPEDVLSALTAVPDGRRRTGTATELTARELEVLGLLAEGVGTAAIAAQLHLSPHTVRNHVKRILAKLEVHSRLEAVAVARQAGLLPARR